ncbi:unnamed protein product [Calypogeia fissa]
MRVQDVLFECSAQSRVGKSGVVDVLRGSPLSVAVSSRRSVELGEGKCNSVSVHPNEDEDEAAAREPDWWCSRGGGGRGGVDWDSMHGQ